MWPAAAQLCHFLEANTDSLERCVGLPLLQWRCVELGAAQRAPEALDMHTRGINAPNGFLLSLALWRAAVSFSSL